MFSLCNTVMIKIKDIPIQWIPKIELYYPDLPQFPIMYLHSFCGGQRVMGFPVSVSYQITGSTCAAEFLVLTNVTVSPTIQTHLENEIKERIGLSQAITEADVLSYCKGQSEYEIFFSELWKYIQASYGNSIPYGRFFEEIYSIVRFVSAWTPKTGRQSEMRMLYNFMSEFGEQAEVPSDWSHLECYFIPTLADLRNPQLDQFSKFKRMFGAIQKVFDREFTSCYSLDGHDFHIMPNAWPKNKDGFIRDVTLPLFNDGILDSGERRDVEILVDAFNRHPWRASFFISSIIVAKTDDYSSWDKDFFIKFYMNGSKLKGYSQKVIACFLQQGFLKDEIIPVDTWIETFHQFPLGIETKDVFYNSFDHLGKLERVIWLASQANKTNMRSFYDLLWCQRYGITGNDSLRGINPIACAECALKNKCAGLNQCRDKLIKLTKNSDSSTFPDAQQSDLTYICVLENDIPKKVYIKKYSGRGKNKKASSWILADEFSGYIMDKPIDLALIQKQVISMHEFIDCYRNVNFSK